MIINTSLILCFFRWHYREHRRSIHVDRMTLLLVQRAVTWLFVEMTLMSNTCRCGHSVSVSLWSLFFLIALMQSSITLAVTSPEAAARRPKQQQQLQGGGHADRTTMGPRRRQPAPLDCSEGLQRCRDNPNCRTLLDTLHRVCDQSSTSLCSGILKQRHVSLATAGTELTTGRKGQ